MTISKNISLITIFSVALSTHLIVVPFWDTPKQPQPQSIHLDAMKQDFNSQTADFRESCKMISDEIKNSMSDKAKMITGVATTGLVGGWLLSKITKSVMGVAIYAGGLYAVGTIAHSLLKDIEDPRKTFEEIRSDMGSLFNHSEVIVQTGLGSVTTTTTNITTHK